MKRFDSDTELRQAVEKASGQRIAKDLFVDLTSDWHPPYTERDLEEILNNFGIERKRTSRKKLPEVIRAIADEVALWQDIQLHRIESELRTVRRKLFGTTKTMDEDGAKSFLANLVGPGEPVRPTFVGLFLEHPITPQDFGHHFEALKPNRSELFFAAVAFVMNRAYLSGREAMLYLLTRKRGIVVAFFNPTFSLVTYRLVHYLQPGGRPARSLLSSREKALLNIVGTAKGRAKPTMLWPLWNHRYPKWSYISWRLFWKDFKRAKDRLLNTYAMAFEAEHMQKEDPQHFWQRWMEIAKGLEA